MTLSVTRDDLLREMGRFLGWNRNPSQWDTRQLSDGEDILRRALTQAYYPAALPGEGQSHGWSFLRPVLNLATQTNIEDYDLPADFGGMTSNLYYSGSEGYPPMVKVPVERILALRQDDTNSVGHPVRYAISPASSGGESPQLWTLMIHPKPAGVYELRGRYRSDPLAVTGSASYPLGGQMFADALVASCVAAADSVINDAYLGNTWMTFLDKLRTAIYIDRQEHFTGNLGYNGDGCDGLPMHEDVSSFTINGVTYGAPAFFFD